MFFNLNGVSKPFPSENITDNFKGLDLASQFIGDLRFKNMSVPNAPYFWSGPFYLSMSNPFEQSFR